MVGLVRRLLQGGPAAAVPESIFAARADLFEAASNDFAGLLAGNLVPLPPSAGSDGAHHGFRAYFDHLAAGGDLELAVGFLNRFRLRQRIQALAALQEHLYRSGDFRSVDFSGALGDLARHLVETAASPIRLSLDLSPADLPVDIAVPLTLIVNEFLTSFLKRDPPRRSESRLNLTVADLKSALQAVIRGEGLDLDPKRVENLIERARSATRNLLREKGQRLFRESGVHYLQLAAQVA